MDEEKRESAIPSSNRAMGTGRVPWYVRTKKLLLGAGALAAAMGAVWTFSGQLFPRDVKDVASIGSVDILGQTTLNAFVAAGTADKLFLGPTPQGAAEELAEPILAPVPSPATPAVPPPAPIDESPPSTITPSPLPSPIDPSPTDPPPDLPTEPSPPPITDSPSPAPDPSVLQSPLTDSAVMAQEIVEDPELEEWDLPLEAIFILPVAVSTVDEADPSPSGSATGDGSAPDIQAGKQLSAEEAAARLAQALEQVDARVGEGGLEPLGYTVVVNFELEGFSQVPILMTWTLDGVDVGTSWSAENVAYRLVASTEHETGFAHIWVPHLQAPGTYNVNVALVVESDRTPVARGKPLAIVSAPVPETK